MPQSPTALRRRRIAGTVAGFLIGVPVLAGGFGAVAEVSQGTTKIAVQPGDTGRDVVCRGQEEIAELNPNIDPTDPACRIGGAALDAETGGLYAGRIVQVEVTTNAFQGNQAASGLPLGSKK